MDQKKIPRQLSGKEGEYKKSEDFDYVYIFFKLCKKEKPFLFALSAFFESHCKVLLQVMLTITPTGTEVVPRECGYILGSMSKLAFLKICGAATVLTKKNKTDKMKSLLNLLLYCFCVKRERSVSS